MFQIRSFRNIFVLSKPSILVHCPRHLLTLPLKRDQIFCFFIPLHFIVETLGNILSRSFVLMGNNQLDNNKIIGSDVS